MSSFASNPFFLPEPCEGDPFLTTDGNSITLSEIEDEINSKSGQMECLEKLGITLIGQTLTIRFKERGYGYVSSKDKSACDSTISEDNFSLRLPLVSDIAPPLCIKIFVEPFIQDGVSFLGRIEFCTLSGITRSVPLTGTGTTALEGRHNDYHATFCTNPSSATFQQRCALIMAIAVATGVREENFELLTLRLEKVASKYHGRKELLDYTVRCVQEEKVETYLQFMTHLYVRGNHAADNCPEMVKSYLDKQGPIPEYYQQLTKYFSSNEIEAKKQAWQEVSMKMCTAGGDTGDNVKFMLIGASIVSVLLLSVVVVVIKSRN